MVEDLGYDFSSRVVTATGGVLIPHHDGDVSIELISGPGSWSIENGVLVIESRTPKTEIDLLLKASLAERSDSVFCISGRKITLTEGSESGYHVGVSVDRENIDWWKSSHGIGSSTKHVEVHTPRAYIDSHVTPMAA